MANRLGWTPRLVQRRDPAARNSQLSCWEIRALRSTRLTRSAADRSSSRSLTAIVGQTNHAQSWNLDGTDGSTVGTSSEALHVVLRAEGSAVRTDKATRGLSNRPQCSSSVRGTAQRTDRGSVRSLRPLTTGVLQRLNTTRWIQSAPQSLG